LLLQISGVIISKNNSIVRCKRYAKSFDELMTFMYMMFDAIITECLHLLMNV
jgi:hypothetical protein